MLIQFSLLYLATGNTTSINIMCDLEIKYAIHDSIHFSIPLVIIFDYSLMVHKYISHCCMVYPLAVSTYSNELFILIKHGVVFCELNYGLFVLQEDKVL